MLSRRVANTGERLREAPSRIEQWEKVGGEVVFIAETGGASNESQVGFKCGKSRHDESSALKAQFR